MILFVIITRLTYLYASPEGSLNAEYRISNLDADLSSPDADLSMMSRHTIFQLFNTLKSGQGEKYEIIAAGRGVSAVNHIYTGE